MVFQEKGKNEIQATGHLTWDISEEILGRCDGEGQCPDDREQQSKLEPRRKVFRKEFSRKKNGIS